MLVLSSSAPPILEVLKDRVSSSYSSSSSSSSSSYSASSSSFALVLRRGCFRRPLVYCCASNLKLMPDSARIAPPSIAEVVGSNRAKDDDKKDGIDSLHSRTFLNVRSGEELLSGIKRESEQGTLPLNIASAMEELYQNYRNAVFSSGIPHADEVVLSNMSAMLDLVLLDVEDPFEFSPYHKAVREPYDYYMFGQNYIRPLIDFGNSYVGNLSVFNDIEEKLRQGHNVVLMSNHQTEADPAVIALLLEKTNPQIAENTIYVAGDRVVTDPLCKPFSMGRNLLCVYSKKHMNDAPELIDMKRRANTRSLKEMALLLRLGSQIIWIAPSGGRDRPDPITHEWHPAPFDIASVDNMRRLVQHAGVPWHIYPLAILCYDIMPPPPQVQKEIGEKRVISFHGTGLSVTPEISYTDVAPGGNEEEAKLAYAKALYDSVNEQYDVLKAAVHGKLGLGASTPTVSLSQSWT